MALIQERHFIACDILSRLLLQLLEALLQSFNGGLLSRLYRHVPAAPGKLPLALLELGPHSMQLVENRLLLFVILRPDGPRAFERHVLVEMRQTGLAEMFVQAADPEGH